MKKKLSAFLALPLLLLTSCGASADFYGKTFVLKGVFDNLDEKMQDGSTPRGDLTKNFASIDWDSIPAITKHSTIDEAFQSMYSHALSAFETYYKDFSITINAKESGWATVKKGESSTGYKASYEGESNSRFVLKDASNTTVFTLYHVLSNNGNFTKVGLDEEGTMVAKVYTFLYTAPIEGIDGVPVTCYGNFLPK